MGVILTTEGQLYSWGENEIGQLGHGDTVVKVVPQKVKAIQGKKVTGVGVGDDFVIALGRTLPQKDIQILISKDFSNLKGKENQDLGQNEQQQKKYKIRATTNSSSS